MTQPLSTAMILAAGRGERLRPLTDSTPKPLLEVGGKRLIEYHIDRLCAAGIRRIVINTAWLAHKIHAALGDGAQYGVRIDYSDEGEALETAGGIIQALPLLDERFIVVNGDVWCDFDFTAWQHGMAQKPAHLLLVDNPRHNLDGDFGIESGLLSTQAQPRYTFSGIAMYHRDFFSGLPAGKAPLAPLLREQSRQGRVSAEYYSGQWCDVGTAGRLHDLRLQLHTC